MVVPALYWSCEEKLDATATTPTEITNIISGTWDGGRRDDGCTEVVANDPLGSFLVTAWIWVASLYRLATVETVTVDKFIADAFFFDHGPLPPLLLWGGLVGFHFIEWGATRNFTLFPWER